MKKILFLIMMLSIGISAGPAHVSAVSEKPASLDVARAIESGDVDALKTILESSPSAVKLRDGEKRTPLHYCAERPVIIQANKSPQLDSNHGKWQANSQVMAELLLKHGADVDARDVFSRTPLHHAANSGNLEVAKVLLANKADINARETYTSSAPLHIVASKGNTAFARFLIENGANVNARDKFGTPLIAAVEEHREMVELLLNNKADVQSKSRDGFAPIHLAGNKDIAQLLLSRGAKLEMPGYQGRTPLHQAAMRNRNDVVGWLCAEGVKVNVVDSEGQTPLLIAISQPVGTDEAKKMSMETISILLRCGADVNYRDKEGRTLLHDAVHRGRQDLVGLLLQHGADINARDKHGYTPLHWAVSSKNIEMVGLLAARGADVNAKNLQGRTPLYDTWGGSKSDLEIAEILKSHGGTK